jgi:Uma2 family endonuclease
MIIPKQKIAYSVGEYWLVDPENQTVEQYGLVGSSYQLLTKLREGDIRSEVVSGFGIPILAMFDPQENLTILQKLLA